MQRESMPRIAQTAANPDVVIPEKKTRKRTKKEVAPAAAVVEEIVVEDHELVQEEPVVAAPKKRGKKAAVKVAVDGTPLVAAAAPVVEPVVVEPVVVEPVVVAEDKKKPLNKFQNFCSIQRAKLKVEKPQLKPKEVTTELGALWKALSPQEQEAFSA